jgi:Dolichyl-phosphate-mannose-protein mannosyltransferase
VVAAGRGLRTGLLAGITLLALLLRLWGVDWQLPHALYYDEAKYAGPAASSALQITGQRADYRNPSLFRHLLTLELRLLNPFLARPADRLAADYRLQTTALLVARLTSALLGTGSVVLIFMVGRRAFGPATGLLAAAMLAVNFLHVHLSHFGLNDVPATFFLVAALVPAAALLERPSTRGYLLSGLCAGLATAAKYNCGIVLVVPLAIWLLQVTRRPASPGRLLLGPLLLSLGALAGFLIGMPEMVGSFQQVQQGFRDQAAFGSNRWIGQEGDPVLQLYSYTLLRAFGLPGVLALLAGLLLLWRRPRLGLSLLAGPLLYLAVMLNQALFFARFALPLVPFGCLFAAFGLQNICARAASPRFKNALLVCASLAVIAWPLQLSIRHDLLAAQPDTRVQAWRWVMANLPPGARLAIEIYSMPIVRPGEPLSQGWVVATFGSLLEGERFQRLTCDGFDYVVTSSFGSDRQRTESRGDPPTGYERLGDEGQRVATFPPGLGGSSVPFHIDDTGLPFWYLEQYVRPGPTVTIYRLPPGLCQS